MLEFELRRIKSRTARRNWTDTRTEENLERREEPQGIMKSNLEAPRIARSKFKPAKRTIGAAGGGKIFIGERASALPTPRLIKLPGVAMHHCHRRGVRLSTLASDVSCNTLTLLSRASSGLGAVIERAECLKVSKLAGARKSPAKQQPMPCLHTWVTAFMTASWQPMRPI